jgi:D-glycero-D-manno-heptose 1,7-bisphosphate phosphatase
VEIYPDVERALIDLKIAGYLLIVVTNQPDVARGMQSRSAVENIHGLLSSRLALDDFRTCYHDDADSCSCRKPMPGLILDAARDHRVDLSASIMVGDRWRDIEAGQRAGCATVFIERDYAERKPVAASAVVSSLEGAARWILGRHRTNKT